MYRERATRLDFTTLLFFMRSDLRNTFHVWQAFRKSQRLVSGLCFCLCVHIVWDFQTCIQHASFRIGRPLGPILHSRPLEYLGYLSPGICGRELTYIMHLQGISFRRSAWPHFGQLGSEGFGFCSDDPPRPSPSGLLRSVGGRRHRHRGGRAAAALRRPIRCDGEGVAPAAVCMAISPSPGAGRRDVRPGVEVRRPVCPAGRPSVAL